MLVQFTVGNFLSFREKTTFSMVASPDEPGHEDRLVTVSESLRLLRVAAIYGSNASGKSNLLKAMDWAQQLILEGTRAAQPIPTEPFLLDTESAEQPSHFEFIYYWENQLLCYGFTCNKTSIVTEWLRHADTDTTIFHRTTHNDVTHVEFSKESLESANVTRERLEFIREGTRPNQLFLTEAVDRNVVSLSKLTDWFRFNPAIIVSRPARLDGFFVTLKNNPERRNSLGEFLKTADTGINEIEIHEDEEKVLSLRARHGKNHILLPPEAESDGTRRLIDLWLSTLIFPKFDKTTVLDELDRSLHPELTRFFLQEWMGKAPPQSQLIFTTHNDNLLEDDLLRRDEVWLMTKKREGASELSSLVEYKIQPKTDVQKAYLHGWFDGIPRLGTRRFYHTIRENSDDADPAA